MFKRIALAIRDFLEAGYMPPRDMSEEERAAWYRYPWH